MLRLVVGLGNPDQRYANTRHNAGAMVIQHWAFDNSNSLFTQHGLHVCSVKENAHQCFLGIPNSYMNHSGKAIQQFLKFYRIHPCEMLVLHDELDLPTGTVRLKSHGGHRGHNGLRDIMQHLGTGDFWRIRIGIDHPGNREQVSDYVLSPPHKEEAISLERAIKHLSGLLNQLITAEHLKTQEQAIQGSF